MISPRRLNSEGYSPLQANKAEAVEQNYPNQPYLDDLSLNSGDSDPLENLHEFFLSEQHNDSIAIKL